jgi:class 3 adenylate cyclase/tetratricopeptide (TPR) repeat protein
VTGIHDWLKQTGLEKYAAVFAEHEIAFEVLPHLTESDIDRLALPTGPRRRLIQAVEALGAATRAARSVQAADRRAEQPEISYAAERRQLTVMFCDLVGSSALAERLDPEDLRGLMLAYRQACDEVVVRYEGHVAQYRGDGMMAYFGWPVAHEDDAERSVRAALDILRAVKAVQATPPLAVRIGLATGTVVVGEASQADDAETKLAVGETPNVAARLQALAGPDQVVIAQATRRLVGATFELSDLGAHALKGIAQPVRAWRADAVQSPPLGRFEAAHHGVPLTPLVGRQEELGLLLRCWRRACDGEGQVVLIGGEPGIGKSRLTHVLREQIAGAPYTALRFQCSPHNRDSTLYPFIDQLETAAGFTHEDTRPQKLDKLEALLVGDSGQRADAAPLIASLLSLPSRRNASLDLSPQERKEKTLRALIGQIRSLSSRQPVLIVFEDVHWIDPTSHELLTRLVTQIRALHILLLITYRPDEYKPQWTGLGHIVTLGLDRLAQRQTVELAVLVNKGRTLPAEVIQQIAERTDGVPLFIEELTKLVMESGALHPELGDNASEIRLAEEAIPPSLHDSLLARVDRLGPAKDIIQIGACIGREFPHRLVARIASLRDEQLTDALRRLIEAGLVYAIGTPPDATYTFKHALVQDAAYASLLRSKRQQLHAQLASVLHADFADRVANEPELLAHHYTQSGSPNMAIPLWRKAGELAARRAALDEAVAHFQRGLALIEHLPPSPERDKLEQSIREPLNGAWIGSRGWAASEVSANATTALELAQRQGTPESALVGMYGLWISTLTQGRIAEALEWAESLLARGNRSGDIDLRILGHTAAMISHFYLGELITAREHCDRGLNLYDPQRAERWIELTGHDAKTVFLGWSAHWNWMLGYPDRAAELSEEKDAYARQLGRGLNLSYALTVGAYVLDYRCEPERLLAHAREADRVAREQSIELLYEAMVPQNEGLAYLRSGRFSEAISYLQRGLNAWMKRGGHTRVPYLKSALAEALGRRGDLDAALDLIEECLGQIERPGWHERVHLAEVLRLKGWLLMQEAEIDEAEITLRASIDWARHQQAKSWELRSSTTLAHLLIERGERNAARELLAPIYNWFTEGFDTHDLVAARKLLESLGGSLGAARQRQ